MTRGAAQSLCTGAVMFGNAPNSCWKRETIAAHDGPRKLAGASGPQRLCAGQGRGYTAFSKRKKAIPMLYTIAVVLIVLWLLGLVTYTMGIHPCPHRDCHRRGAAEDYQRRNVV
jgi:hypothetical protein